MDKSKPEQFQSLLNNQIPITSQSVLNNSLNLIIKEKFSKSKFIILYYATYLLHLDTG